MTKIFSQKILLLLEKLEEIPDAKGNNIESRICKFELKFSFIIIILMFFI